MCTGGSVREVLRNGSFPNQPLATTDRRSERVSSGSRIKGDDNHTSVIRQAAPGRQPVPTPTGPRGGVAVSGVGALGRPSAMRPDATPRPPSSFGAIFPSTPPTTTSTGTSTTTYSDRSAEGGEGLSWMRTGRRPVYAATMPRLPRGIPESFDEG